MKGIFIYIIIYIFLSEAIGKNNKKAAKGRFFVGIQWVNGHFFGFVHFVICGRHLRCYFRSTDKLINREDGEIIHNRKVGMEPAGLAVASELNARYGGIRFYDRRISFKEMIFISPSRFFILP